jgi:hypothetical protein
MSKIIRPTEGSATVQVVVANCPERAVTVEDIALPGDRS